MVRREVCCGFNPGQHFIFLMPFSLSGSGSVRSVHLYGVLSCLDGRLLWLVMTALWSVLLGCHSPGLHGCVQNGGWERRQEWQRWNEHVLYM